MDHPALLLSATLVACCPAALAQAPAAPPAPATPASQLDQIEQKLDEVLRRLDHPREQPPGPAQAASVLPGAATLSAAAITLPTIPPEPYKPGALVVVRPAPRHQNGLAAIPPDSVGGSVYTGGPIPFIDFGTRGVRYTGPVGAEIQGWPRAKEAWRYQLAVDLPWTWPSASGLRRRRRLASCKPGSRTAALTSALLPLSALQNPAPHFAQPAAPSLARRAARVLPAGGFGNMDGNTVIVSGKAGHVWDSEGREYIDFLIGSGPMLVGHAHPEIVAAAQEQMALGTTFFANNPHGIRLAEAIVDAVPCADQVRFTSSGTEADAYANLSRTFNTLLRDRGIFKSPSKLYVSLAHDEADVTPAVAAFHDAAQALRATL